MLSACGKRLKSYLIKPCCSRGPLRRNQNVILSNFDVSTVILPKDRLHKEGGFYEKKMKDGYEVLEVEKGGWAEAIFIKEKQEQE